MQNRDLSHKFPKLQFRRWDRESVDFNMKLYVSRVKMTKISFVDQTLTELINSQTK